MKVRYHFKYRPQDDRIQLLCYESSSPVFSVWMTQRLLLRLVPSLKMWQGKIAPGVVWSAAGASRSVPESRPLPPIESTVPSWVVRSVKAVAVGFDLRLELTGVARERLLLVLSHHQFIRWMAALHAAYLDAEWPPEVWDEPRQEDPFFPAHGPSQWLH